MPNSPHPDLRLDVPIPSTPPARNRARSSSPPRSTPRGTPRATSPDFRYASPRPDQSPNLSREISFESGVRGGLSGVAKAIGQRFVRTVRRGNLPFMLVFVSCIIVFFTSLAGIGYVAPDEVSATVEFLPGTPVFDLAGRQALERRMEEQRALEQTWAKKKRPKDGAWMQRARDDKAYRRNKSAAAAATTTSSAYGAEPSVISDLDEAQRDEDPLS